MQKGEKRERGKAGAFLENKRRSSARLLGKDLGENN